MTDPDPAALDSFIEFSRWHIASGDVDPAYPVVAAIADAWGLSDTERVDWILTYVAWYHLGSGLAAWELCDGLPDGSDPRPARLPTGVERRNLRGGEPMLRHLSSLNRTIDSAALTAAGWLGPGRMRGGVSGWRWVRDTLEEPYGNGRWASYKTAELLQKAAGWPLTAPDAGHDFSSGPRKGLALLFGGDLPGNSPATIAALDERTETLRQILSAEGITRDVAEVETCLCDWHSARHGHYYVGHDLDMMLVQTADLPEHHRRLVLDARAEAFDARWLGEVGGWETRPDLNRLLVEEGRVEWW